MAHYESQFPKDTRKQEIGQLLDMVKKGKSSQLISVFGAGRSTVLRLLTFNSDVRRFHLGNEAESYLFIYVNFAEISTKEDIYKLMFYNLNSALKTHEQLSVHIDPLFKEALHVGDHTVLFQLLKQAFEEASKEHSIVLLFDRFSEFSNLVTSDLFANLRSLKAAAGGKLSIIFSVHRPIELLFPSIWEKFAEYVINQVFINLKDEYAVEARISLLQQNREKQIQSPLRKMVFAQTGGHGKLTRLACELVLDADTGIQDEKELGKFLLSNPIITAALYEIWQNLTTEEKTLLKQEKTNEFLTQLCLPFPLLTQFIKLGKDSEFSPKTIRIQENELFYGDEQVSGLTNQEFRLISYFVNNPNKICSREEVIAAVWSDTKTQQGVTNEALDQMIFRVRKKIEDEPDNPKHLLTIKGRGFRFIP